MKETYPNLVPRAFTLKKMGGAEGSLDPKTQPFPVSNTDNCKGIIFFNPFFVVIITGGTVVRTPSAFYRPYLREWFIHTVTIINPL